MNETIKIKYNIIPFLLVLEILLIFIFLWFSFSTSHDDIWTTERSSCEKDGGIFTINDPRLPGHNTLCTHSY